jgi:hypothetical protein
MPKNDVTGLITDLEMQFARLILSGTMTDRAAAEAVGLDPESAAYIKSMPRVRDYMLEHRAAVEQKLIEQDAGELRRRNQSRDQVLERLWEIARLDTEKTRNSASAQVKALSMIVAIEGLIPDRHSTRRAVSPQNIPVPPPVHPPFYKAAWNRTQQDGENVDPGPFPAPAPEEAASELQSASGGKDAPVSAPAPDPTPMELSSRLPRRVVGPERSEGPAVLSPLNSPQTTSSAPRVPMADYFAPDTRVPFSIPKNPFARRRW